MSHHSAPSLFGEDSHSLKELSLICYKRENSKSATEPAGHASLSDRGLRWDTPTMRARLYRRCSCRGTA